MKIVANGVRKVYYTQEVEINEDFVDMLNDALKAEFEPLEKDLTLEFVVSVAEAWINRNYDELYWDNRDLFVKDSILCDNLIDWLCEQFELCLEDAREWVEDSENEYYHTALQN